MRARCALLAVLLTAAVPLGPTHAAGCDPLPPPCTGVPEPCGGSVAYDPGNGEVAAGATCVAPVGGSVGLGGGGKAPRPIVGWVQVQDLGSGATLRYALPGWTCTLVDARSSATCTAGPGQTYDCAGLVVVATSANGYAKGTVTCGYGTSVVQTAATGQVGAGGSHVSHGVVSQKAASVTRLTCAPADGPLPAKADYTVTCGSPQPPVVPPPGLPSDHT